MRAGDDLVALVQDALQHLYDFPYLQNHPLAGRLQPGVDPKPREKMRLLRTTLLDAIEKLNPGPNAPVDAPQMRPYSVLNLHYVAGMTMDAVARELAISERQAYRDLRKAEQDLASLVAAQCTTPAPATDAAPQPEDLVLREAERLGSGKEEVDVSDLVQGALSAVERLGQQLGVRLNTGPLPAGRRVLTDRALARHALVNVLSFTLQDAAAGTSVNMAVDTMGPRVRIQVTYRTHAAPRGPEVSMAMGEQLVRYMGGQWATIMGTEGIRTITFTLGERPQFTLLVIDDNEGLHELFRRYLADEDLRLCFANNGRDGLRMAEEAEPDLIVLDVMMPGEDGWSVLQALRNREATGHIPVIVCSVFKDPQLALSLGAVSFLAKPVDRSQFLQALARFRPGRRSPSRPAGPAGI